VFVCVCEGDRMRQSETERETVCLFLRVCARALLRQHVGDQVHLCECEYICIYMIARVCVSVYVYVCL